MDHSFRGCETDGRLPEVPSGLRGGGGQMGQTLVDQPGYGSSLREVAFRCYRVDNDWFGTGKKVSDLEAYLKSQSSRLFVDRIRHNGQITDTPKVRP